MYGYIYKTTNLVNDKIYVGQHKASDWDEDYKGSGKMLFRAFDKYGKDNFKCELLEAVESQSEMNSKEKYYIELYNARDNAIGYNIAEGGIGGSHPAWNKGMTKENNESVKKYTDNRNKLFQEREHIGCYGLKGADNKNSVEARGVVEKILPEFEEYWKTHSRNEVWKYFHIGPKAYNMCMEILGLDGNDETRDNAVRERHASNWRNSLNKNGKNGIPIRCVETGEEYKSIKDARIAIGLASSSALYRAIYDGYLCKGYHWEKI